METTKKDVYQMVTDRIIEEMEKGIISWQRPWRTTGNDIAFMPMINHTTGKPYSMLNCMLLGREGEYLTYNQVKAEGGNIKKGAKSRFVVFFRQTAIKKPIRVMGEDGIIRDDFETIQIPLLKYYNVFHIDDCEGINPKWAGKLNGDDVKHNDPIECAENVVNGYDQREQSLTISRHSTSNKAYFSPSRDMVVVPMIDQYDDVNEYYSTLFHECVHSTGVKSRCDRGLEVFAGFGSESYSKEELVAEIGSAMLVNFLGLDANKAFRNSVAYLQGWLKALKNDKKLIVSAASRAEKAVKYILDNKE